jgi:hypothetical protein
LPDLAASFFSSFAGVGAAADSGLLSSFISPPQPQLDTSCPQPQLEQPQLLSQPQPIDQPPQLPQQLCEKRWLKQPPKEPPWLPQLDSQQVSPLGAQALQPPQLPLLPNQKALAVHGTANTAAIKAIR